MCLTTILSLSVVVMMCPYLLESSMTKLWQLAECENKLLPLQIPCCYLPASFPVCLTTTLSLSVVVTKMSPYSSENWMTKLYQQAEL